MKTLLSSVLLVGILSINTILFMTLTSGTASCGGGATLYVNMSIRMPSFPVTFETCGTANQYFSFNNLTYPDPSGPGDPYGYEQWYMTVNVSHGSTVLMNDKYGNLPLAGGMGIRKYNMSGCNDQAFVAGSDCAKFPVKLKEGETNTVSVRIVAPCNAYQYGVRSQVLFTNTRPNVPSNQGDFTIGPNQSETQVSVFHGVACNPC